MAKELPYFKFEPGEWDNGNIQICDRQSKGLFIDICCMYWSRIGELPYALALQKLCKGDAKQMQQLIDNEILMIDGDNIHIEFLDEQLEEFSELSEKRAKAANKRWNAKAMQKQSKSNAIREEKIILDKIKEDKYLIDVQNFLKGELINIEIKELQSMANSFVNQRLVEGDIHKTFPEYASYFINKIKKEYTNKPGKIGDIEW